MEQIIKKAIEGGYLVNQGNGELPEKWNIHRGETLAWKWYKELPYQYLPIHHVLMSQDFWQALSKACGWSKRVCKGCGSPKKQLDGEYHLICPKCNRGGESRIDMHLFYALRFHEINLTEGWDKAVEWLYELVISDQEAAELDRNMWGGRGKF